MNVSDLTAAISAHGPLVVVCAVQFLALAVLGAYTLNRSSRMERLLLKVLIDLTKSENSNADALKKLADVLGRKKP